VSKARHPHVFAMNSVWVYEEHSSCTRSLYGTDDRYALGMQPTVIIRGALDLRIVYLDSMNLAPLQVTSWMTHWEVLECLRGHRSGASDRWDVSMCPIRAEHVSG